VPGEEILQAVLLDVGGTLLTEEPPRAAIYAEVARARGLDVRDDAMRGLMARTHDALPRVLDGAYRYSDRWFEAFIERIFVAELGLHAARLPGVTAELFTRFESAATFRLRPGCRELLAGCRARGLALGAVSNWSARLPRVLAAVGIANAFDAVACSALERCEKPDPALFRTALDRLGVAPGAALHAGDHPRNDGYGARAAGVGAVLVDHAGRLAADPGARGFPRVGGLPELRDRILSRLP
jgi:putative hydrolase of the HAD superfamily